MFNSMRAAYEPALEMLSAVIDEKAGAYRALTAAVVAGDADLAAARAHELLAQATTSLLAAIDKQEAGR
jgi:hypothetical protein